MSLKIFLQVWHMVTVQMLRYAAQAKNKGPELVLLEKQWSDVRFLQMVAGLIDIAHIVTKAEKKLQAHDVTFVERDGIMQELETSLRANVSDEP